MIRDPLAADPRVALAQERTLLAWVRTGVALMGFGFVVARFSVFLRELVHAVPNAAPRATGASEAIGATLVMLGVVVNVVAAIQHVHRLRQLARGELFTPRPLFGVTVALLLAALGAGMAGYLLRLTP